MLENSREKYRELDSLCVFVLSSKFALTNVYHTSMKVFVLQRNLATLVKFFIFTFFLCVSSRSFISEIMGKHKNKIKDHSPKHKRMKTKRKRSSHTKKYSREGRSSRRRKSDVSSSDDSMFRDDTSSVESTQDKSRDHSRKRRRGKDDENSSSFVQKKGSESCSEDSSSDDKRENNAGAGSRRKSKKSKELSPFTKSYERWRNIPGSEDFKGHLQRTLVEPQSSTTDDRRKYFRQDDRGKQIYVNKSRKHHDSSHELSEGAKSSASRENSPESSNERSQNEDKDFSFTVYQYELNKIFCRDASLIPDKEDFWLFVKKYEAMKRTKSQKCNLEGK